MSRRQLGVKKLRLLLLDAGIVIELFRRGIWKKMVQECDIHLTETVVGESDHYEGSEGRKHLIDLGPEMADGTVTVFEVEKGLLKSFIGRFTPLYIESLDDGEAETLACLVDDRERESSASALLTRSCIRSLVR